MNKLGNKHFFKIVNAARFMLHGRQLKEIMHHFSFHL